MAGPRIEYTEDARRDLHELAFYIAERDGAARATRALDRIARTITTLAAMPRMGRHRPYLPVGSRAFQSSRWVIVYDPLPDGILVQRVVDGVRDLSALFRGS